MKPLRIGLAGYGNWAREAYVPALRADGRGTVVAASAPSRATRERIREELGEEVRIFPDFEAMLGAGGLDGVLMALPEAVLMALPEAVHEPALLAAVASGIPFFYEPPVSHRRDRIAPVLEALLEAAQIQQADLELRFLPVVGAAALRLAEGAIGEPQTARIRMNGNWNARPGAGLSLPLVLAPWYVDVLDAMLDSHPQRVLVQDGRGTEGRMQAYALTQLDYGGVWGSFQANISSVQGPETWVEVQGRDGDLFADLFTGELRLRSRSDPEWRVDRVVSALRPFAGWPGLRECLSEFLDQLEGKPVSGVPAEDMARLHCLGLAAEESIDTLAWARVRSMDELRRNLR